jgi:hypothetical protein
VLDAASIVETPEPHLDWNAGGHLIGVAHTPRS